jgi:O-antigen ligase
LGKKHEVVDRIIEVGIYLYIILMFLTKGEGIRNILIFGNFGLWLLTIKHRKNLYILKEPVSILCWLFLGVTLFSVIFSIDPLYSLWELRGSPLKLALLFPVISTVMADEKRLNKVVYFCFFTNILIVLIGYYSYFFYDIPMLKPYTSLMHTGHAGANRFARYFNTLLPFSFIILFLWKKPALKSLFIFSLLIFIISLVLSGSRGGYISFLSIVSIWTIYISKTRGYNLKKVIACLVIIILVIGSLSWFYSPYIRWKISKSSEDLFTFSLRTEVWGAAICAIKERPLVGWGYGNGIFHKDEPYMNTPYKEAPPKGTHNMFLRILFHQGIIGFIPYVSLLLLTVAVFWKEAFRSTGIKSYILIACVSVFVGNYMLNALLENTPNYIYLAVVLGLGMAAKGTDENSHN